MRDARSVFEGHESGPTPFTADGDSLEDAEQDQDDGAPGADDARCRNEANCCGGEEELHFGEKRVRILESVDPCEFRLNV